MGEVLQLLGEPLPLCVAAAEEFVQHQEGAVNPILSCQTTLLAAMSLILKASPHLRQALFVPEGEGEREREIIVSFELIGELILYVHFCVCKWVHIHYPSPFHYYSLYTLNRLHQVTMNYLHTQNITIPPSHTRTQPHHMVCCISLVSRWVVMARATRKAATACSLIAGLGSLTAWNMTSRNCCTC